MSQKRIKAIRKALNYHPQEDKVELKRYKKVDTSEILGYNTLKPIVSIKSTMSLPTESKRFQYQKFKQACKAV